MTEPLTIDDLTYIPIRDAAVSSRLSTEYLARLARQRPPAARELSLACGSSKPTPSSNSFPPAPSTTSSPNKPANQSPVRRSIAP